MKPGNEGCPLNDPTTGKPSGTPGTCSKNCDCACKDGTECATLTPGSTCTKGTDQGKCDGQCGCNTQTKACVCAYNPSGNDADKPTKFSTINVGGQFCNTPGACAGACTKAACQAAETSGLKAILAFCSDDRKCPIQ